MEVSEKMMENWFCDLQKKEIDKFERAQNILQYLKLKKISQREFARRYNIPKSNIEDWLLWNRLKREEFEKYLSQGYSERDIYRLLRNNKKKTLQQIFQLETPLDLILYRFSKKVEDMCENLPEKSRKTIEMIIEAKNKLTMLEKHYGGLKE